MSQITVRTVRNNFPSALRAVHAGESVEVTRRGKVVAVLMPPATAWDADLLAREVRQRFRGRRIRANLGAALAKDR